MFWMFWSLFITYYLNIIDLIPGMDQDIINQMYEKTVKARISKYNVIVVAGNVDVDVHIALGLHNVYFTLYGGI